MAKKILGDDPFAAKGTTPTPPKPKKNSAPNKTKRAPSGKTEAPRAARVATPAKKTAAPKPKAAAAPVTVAVTEAVADTVSAPVSDTVTAPASDTVTAPVPVAAAVTSLAPRSTEEPPTDAAPGSWRWWRFRQLQLARAEDAAWLARHDGDSRSDRFGRDPVLAGRAEPIVDLVYRSVLRVSVRGLGHVPETGRAILVARRRHATYAGVAGLALAGLAKLGLPISMSTPLDAAMISHAIRTEHVAHREVRPLVRPARLYTPLVGMLLRRLGGVPADVHDLARLLDDDRLALAFVEADGSASLTDGGALDLSTLVALALVTGAPIVPVVIAGGAPRRIFGGPELTAVAFGTPQFPGAEFGVEGAEDEALVARLADEFSAQLAAN